MRETSIVLDGKAFGKWKGIKGKKVKVTRTKKEKKKKNQLGLEKCGERDTKKEKEMDETYFIWGLVMLILAMDVVNFKWQNNTNNVIYCNTNNPLKNDNNGRNHYGC